MNVTRIVDPDRIRSTHIVIVCLLGATVAGSCLLTSGPHAMMEGAKDWRQESPLRAIVGVLNLNYTQTTAQGVEIKWLVFGLGAAIGAMVCGLSLLIRDPAAGEVSDGDTFLDPSHEVSGVGLTGRQVSPHVAAQVLMAAFAGWAFLSALWSSAPAMSAGDAVLPAIGVVWALVLGRGLNRPTAGVGGWVLLGICAVTALLAIAYFGERNPTRRASYPIGNPLFLAACLIPGVVLSTGLILASVGKLRQRLSIGSVIVVALCAVALGLILWATSLTSARGGALAMAVGLGALVFFAAGRRAKPAVLGIGAVLAAIGFLYLWPHFSAPSSTGRDASLRLRGYAWGSAADLIERAMFLGHGQGGFARFGDAAVAAEVMNDPLALDARIAHAHNEWLEVWVDLGVIGLALVGSSLVLTVWAGMVALPSVSNTWLRWTLCALMAALVALIVEECADTGLRVAGLPAVFYTVIGLIWALTRAPLVNHATLGKARPLLQRLAGIGALAAGIVLAGAVLFDFQAARAYYEVSAVLQRRAFDEAGNRAELAAKWRLGAQRRLASLERLASTHLYAAREYQTSSLDRRGRAQSTDPPDAHLMRLAGVDRRESEAHIKKATAAIKALVERSPGFWGAGWIEYRLYQLRGVFALTDGDESLASTYQVAAGDALHRELKRRPHDPFVALSFAEVSGDSLSWDERFEVLARPLRHSTIPAAYVQFLIRASSQEGFDDEFIPIWQRIVPSSPDAVSDDTLAAEKLRLAALIRFARDDYARAYDTAMMAAKHYEAVDLTNTLGAAACYAELADYRFFTDSTYWQQAVAFAQRAMEIVPQSTPGRQLEHAVRDRMVTYYLAGNDESTAGRLLGFSGIADGDRALSAELSARYGLLCKNMIRRSRERFPVDFERWIERALELDANNELALRLSAQVHYDKGNIEESIFRLQQSLASGADPSVVYAFVRLALSQNPDHAGFAALERELRARLLRAAPAADARSPSAATGSASSPDVE